MKANRGKNYSLLAAVLVVTIIFTAPVYARGIVFRPDGSFQVQNGDPQLFIFGDFIHMKYTDRAYVRVEKILDYLINYLIDTRLVMNSHLVQPGHTQFDLFAGDAAILLEDALTYLTRNEGIDFFTNEPGHDLPDLTERVIELALWIDSRNEGLRLAAAEFAQVHLYQHLSARHTADDRIRSTKFYLTQAAEFDPSWIEADILLAEALLFEGKPYNALSVLERNVLVEENSIFLRSNPNLAPFLKTIASFTYHGHELRSYKALALGSVSEVDTIIEYRYTYNIDDWYTAYAKAKIAALDPLEGIRFARLAIERNPINYRAWLALGEALFNCGELEEAGQVYERVNSLVSEVVKGRATFETQYTYHHLAVAELAVLAYFENDLAAAVDYVVDLDKKLPMIHHLRRSHIEPLLEIVVEELHTLSDEAFIAGDTETALWGYKLMERIAPDNPSVLYRLILIYNRLEDDQRVGVYLERLLYDHPNSTEARVLLEMTRPN